MTCHGMPNRWRSCARSISWPWCSAWQKGPSVTTRAFSFRQRCSPAYSCRGSFRCCLCGRRVSVLRGHGKVVHLLHKKKQVYGASPEEKQPDSPVVKIVDLDAVASVGHSFFKRNTSEAGHALLVNRFLPAIPCLLLKNRRPRAHCGLIVCFRRKFL